MTIAFASVRSRSASISSSRPGASKIAAGAYSARASNGSRATSASHAIGDGHLLQPIPGHLVDHGRALGDVGQRVRAVLVGHDHAVFAVDEDADAGDRLAVCVRHGPAHDVRAQLEDEVALVRHRALGGVMAFGGGRYGRAAQRSQGGGAIRIGHGRSSPSTSRAAASTGALGAASDDADGHLARLLGCRLRGGDEREVLATRGQNEGEGEDEESEPERAAGQQGQVLSAGGSVSSSGCARAAARRAATVGVRSPAVLYRALPTTSTSPPLASATPIVSRFTPPSTPIGKSSSRRSDLVAEGSQLRDDVVEERLSAPSGMDGHDQQQVHPVEPRQDRLGRGLGVQGDPRPLARSLDLRDHGARLVIGLDVEDDQVAPGLREALGVARAAG